MPVLLIALVRENGLNRVAFFWREFLVYSSLQDNVAFIAFAGKFNHTRYGCERDTKTESSNDGRRHQISVSEVQRIM